MLDHVRIPFELIIKFIGPNLISFCILPFQEGYFGRCLLDHQCLTRPQAIIHLPIHRDLRLTHPGSSADPDGYPAALGGKDDWTEAEGVRANWCEAEDGGGRVHNRPATRHIVGSGARGC